MNNEEKQYFGYRVRQRTSPESLYSFVFCARAKDLKAWVGIRRTKEVSEGSQRLLKTARQKAITKFLKSELINTIPNNILVSFEPSANVLFQSVNTKIADCIDLPTVSNGCDDQLEWGYISFIHDTDKPEAERPALLVDGQHRLFGIADYAQENLPITVVALLDADKQEQAFQFIVINNKAVKVNTDNVKSIIVDLDEAQLESRLEKASIRYGDHNPFLRSINDLEDSPFKGLLSWDYNRTADESSVLVNVTAVEQCLRDLPLIFSFLTDDDDSLLDLFLTIWTAVSQSFETLWAKDKVFMRKINLISMNEFLASKLRVSWSMSFVNIFDAKDVDKQVRTICNKLNPEFWTSEWSVKIQDNANVKNLILKDLDTIIDNFNMHQSWKSDLILPKKQTMADEG